MVLFMKLTRNNLNEVIFENQDARLLIEDVVSHTRADLYYYHDVEITVAVALRIWNKAVEAEDMDSPYRVTFPFAASVSGLKVACC